MGDYMNYLKKFVKAITYVISISLVVTILVTVLSYFNIFNDGIIKFLKLLTPIISIFIGGFIMGRGTNKKGYIEGIKLALVIDFIFILISILLNNFKVESLIFYIILFITSIFGSIIGIQKKVKN